MEQDRPSRYITHGGAASELPWSPDFVMQAIELLVVSLVDGVLESVRPAHADSFIIGWPVRAKPEEVAAQTLERLGLKPDVLHSTSWRHAGDEVVLTYIAVVPGESPVPQDWVRSPVARAELARGDATAPPPVIGVSQVLEHALRHLAWLVNEDEVIGQALPGWNHVLKDYVPEPFRALGAPPAPA